VGAASAAEASLSTEARLPSVPTNIPARYAIACVWLLCTGLCAAQDTSGGGSAPAPPVQSAYTPPPHKSVFKRFFSTEAVGATLPGAIVQQLHDWPDEWGKGRPGFEKRAGSLYGQFVIGVFIEDGVKALHPEDTRYRRSGQGSFFRRTGHVIVATVTARKPDGRLTPAWSLPANAYGSWAVATLWSPREYRNAESIFKWGSAGLAVTPILNFAREFWPDLRGVFRKRE